MGFRRSRRARWRRLAVLAPPLERGPLLRFVTPHVHDASRRRTGVFRAAGRLMHHGGLPPEARPLLEEEMDWFNAELPVPPRRVFAGGRAICWFKADARGCIQRLWTVVRVLRASGVRVDLVRTSARPGEVRYEDEFQVVAVPYASTP